jgi:glutathione S-transferase
MCCRVSSHTLYIFSSPLVNWAAYELGLELERGDLGQNPHPFRQIPCLADDDDVTVFESGAIILYLLDKASPANLTPSQKAQVISWVSWANASLDPICFLETPDGKV